VTGVLFDLDGVLYEGEKPIEGAGEVIAWFDNHGVPFLFLTNTTSRPRTALVEKLGRFGIAAERGMIFTPPVAAVDWLRRYTHGKVALFVPEATKREFADLPLVDADAESGAAAVVVGDLGEGWDFRTLNRAFRLLAAAPHVRLVALGMTRYWKAADGLRLDAAPFVVALRHASGVEPVVLGKPSGAFFRAALSRLGQEAQSTLMIGDDIRGDIEGAQQAGLRGILVRTGKYRSGDLDQGIAPYAVIDSVLDLPAWWERHVGVD
jgi:phospholysine phosphohistidine inorganic pyrophosphate phosphatase